ncbi:hypothetical protein HYALB_00008995 [Hymenoscyphus albidus]|uniref:Uncharacterized protein n=1 Tax=Hymenoscyphus albidus TaxID=595503 RepID=A0A9N9LSX2_9HELO|nr:hypothetical protein HYALB_00008995 [Hymenoscyphus albidus]
MPNNRDGMGDKPLPNHPVMSRKQPPSSHHRDPNPRRLSRTGSLKQNSSQQSQPPLPPRSRGAIGETEHIYSNEERMLRNEGDQIRSQSPGNIAASRLEAGEHPAAATSKEEKNRNGEREYDVIVGDVEQMAAELIESRRLLHETQKRYDESTAELSSRHIVDPFRKGDQIIAREIDGLRSDIRSGIAQTLKNFVNPPDPEYTFFRIVTPDYRQYLNADGKEQSLLIQSFI